jgi:RNA polymerase sigma-70 factor (ECF subfamily)
MNPDKIFDELLILKCQEGDGKAFELIIKRWNKKLISFAYKITRDLDSAHDIAQESWISIHKGLRKLQEPSKFSSWAFRITYNKSMDYLRYEKKQNQTELLTDHEALTVNEIDDDGWTTVSSLIENLPIQHKTILLLFYLEKQSIKEIAIILELPEGTVKSRIFYARELLKRKYKEVKNEKF